MTDHLAQARIINDVHDLTTLGVYNRVGLVHAAAELVSQLVADAEAALTTAARLVDVVEAGGEDEEIYTVALTLGGDAATAVATGYQVAAALQITDFEARVGRVLTSTLSHVS